MRNRRTPHRPLFDVLRPDRSHWKWIVTYKVASSGYPTDCHVQAMSDDPLGDLVGAASCAVKVGDDLSEVIECLAIEAMLAACQPTLTGEPTTRRVVFSTNL